MRSKGYLQRSLRRNLASIQLVKERRSTEVERTAHLRLVTADLEGIRSRSETLYGFVKEAWHVVEPRNEFVDNWHLWVLCQHLEAVSRGTFLALGYDNRLIINVPPGTMKSLIVSVFWQAWEWGPFRHPEYRYIGTSFVDRNAERDSLRTRDLVLSEWYQALWPAVFLNKRGETFFKNTDTGERRAIPFGSLTSGRANRLAIDDPHSTESAESEADRTRTTRRFRESAPSRLVDPIRSAIVLIMQRLHTRDCTAVALEAWRSLIHVMLPHKFEVERCCYTPLPNPEAPTPYRMRYLRSRQMWLPDEGWEPRNEQERGYVEEFNKAKPETVYRWDRRTQDGELLDPVRFPADVLERDAKVMDTFAVAGQFQQRPTSRQGGWYKRSDFRYVPAAPRDCIWVRHWDLASTKRKGSPYTAGLKLGYSPSQKQWFIAHVERFREEGVQRDIKIRNIAEADYLEHGHDLEISIPQDPGQAGKTQVQAMIANLAIFRVHAEPESGDKHTRALPTISQVEGGNVAIVTGGDTMPPWVEAFLQECELAPNGLLDQIDAFSGAYSRILTRPSSGIRVGTARGST